MFGKKKATPKRDHSGKNLSQYGLFDVPTNLSFENDDDIDEGDSDLEAELAALSGGGKPKKPPRKKHVPQADLDSMVAESMKDIPSDEELSGDEDDPDLLNELSELTGVDHDEEPLIQVEEKSSSNDDSSGVVSLLKERLKLYETAESNAKEAGESSRARRFNRGVKTLKDLVKQAEKGGVINPDDIPPEVTVNIRKNDNKNDTVLSPTRVAPPPPPQKPQIDANNQNQVINEEPKPIELSEDNKKLLELCNQRRNEYKMAAVIAKKAGDLEAALTYVKVVKAFEQVIKAVENGQTVDVSDMPGPPPPYEPKKEENSVEKQENVDVPQIPVENEEPEQLITAGSLEEALQQRLEVYKKQEDSAKEQGNSSKARRMGRIVKQFEQAIKSHKSGKPVPLDELPNPPGYAPLIDPKPQPKLPENEPKPTPKKEEENKIVVTPKKHQTTRAEKQLKFLLAQQKEFKLAAINAKKKGEVDQAKEYLRAAKGFDPLIEASQGGLPVDISSLPLPPSARSKLENEFELVMPDECTEEDTDRDVLTRLESQLNKQLKMCLTTRDHNKAIGDVAGTNRFERLALSVSKDLDLVRLAKKSVDAAIPTFHYEMKEFSVVKTFTELNDNDVELFIIRGINYNCANPKEIDTYVKFEFPYPQEETYKEKTSTVKNTNNPEYDSKYLIPIQRSVRTCLRVFKRHSVKFEVYSKGCCASELCCFRGFFRSDALLGTVNVKLQPLETQCEIHDSFDIMDGRKKTGGKLEVKIRVRNPMVSKQIEQISEKWLVLDH
nr:coiled-coil and C2 domain-containing protein 1-like isoform X1 [Onthophagus taurus]